MKMEYTFKCADCGAVLTTEGHEVSRCEDEIIFEIRPCENCLSAKPSTTVVIPQIVAEGPTV